MLDATTLKNLWKTKIQAIPNYPAAGMSPIFSDDRILQALAEGVVQHIQSAAVVSIAVVGADPQGGTVNSFGNTGTVS